MARSLAQRQHVELDFSQLADKDLHDLVGAIKLAAPTSQLVLNSQPMQASLAALLTKDTAFAQAGTAVTNDRAKLKTDLATEVTCRSDIVGEIRCFATLAENGSKLAGDLQGAGLPARARAAKKSLPPDTPESIDTVLPKKGHGKATVSVHETGKTRRQYAAEYSLDPYGPTTWAPLGKGYGKSRLVTGASGTKIWVRFATVRGQLQSDWCTPVLVTIP
jgi:hypothetical protein